MNDEVFDRIVMEAIYSDTKLSAGDIKNLDSTEKIALMIYDSGDIQAIKNAIKQLPEINEKDPKEAKAVSKMIIKKIDVVIGNLERLKEEFKHRGNYDKYKRDKRLNMILQCIGTTLMVAVTALLSIEIPYVVAAGGAFNTYFVLKDGTVKADDMEIYRQYAKLKNKDPLKVCQYYIDDLYNLRKLITIAMTSD